MLAEVAQRAAEAAEAEEKAYRDSLEAQTAKKTNGAGTAKPFVPVEDTEIPQEITNED
jgi:hypothetical protein